MPTGVQPPEAPYPRTERKRLDRHGHLLGAASTRTEAGTSPATRSNGLATGVEGTFRSLTSPAATARLYTHTGLTPGNGLLLPDAGAQQLRVGTSGRKRCGKATERDVVPDAPTLTATANGSSEINLSWTKPDGKGAPITEYELEYYSDEYEGWFWVVRGPAVVGDNPLHRPGRG